MHYKEGEKEPGSVGGRETRQSLMPFPELGAVVCQRGSQWSQLG